MEALPQQASYRDDETEVVESLPFEPLKSIDSEMYGPGFIGLDQTGDFVIYVANTTNEEIRNIEVSLNVSQGIDIVLIDREATVDNEASRLVWLFEQMQPGEEHFIRYRVKSLDEGIQTQRVTVSTDDSELECEFDTEVVPAFEESRAPFLPYESDENEVE